MVVDTQLFNNFFLEQEKVILCQPFVLNDNIFKGIILVQTSKGDLTFEVCIPSSFPYSHHQTCIKFDCKELIGYLHINPDNSVCIHTVFDRNPKRKLDLEYKALLQWIQDFYIDEIEDKNYGYLLLNHTQNSVNLLFHNDFTKHFSKNDKGNFEFSVIGNNSHNTIFCLQSIDNQELKWNNGIKSFKKFSGIWVFIEQEPIVQRRQPVENWQELSTKYLNSNLCQFIIDYLLKAQQQNRKPFLLLGYHITHKDKKEVHWELIDISNIQYDTVKEHRFYYPVLKNVPILWQKTSNCSYNRFFGRGKLSDTLTEKNIVLVGCGAIGSNLATILVRGGVKNVTLVDFDTVESGNICRANYNLFGIGESKVISLKFALEAISPHIIVKICGEIPKLIKDTKEYNDLKKLLQENDIIFDCSVDEELSFLFDEMDLNMPIFNLSITNKAKELACISGKNIYENKYRILLHLPHEEAKFYEGLGCQYPTFEASHLDIQSLLTYAVKSIELQLNEGKTNSFVIATNIQDNNYKMLW
jgi:hypothetical protein